MWYFRAVINTFQTWGRQVDWFFGKPLQELASSSKAKQVIQRLAREWIRLELRFMHVCLASCQLFYWTILSYFIIPCKKARRFESWFLLILRVCVVFLFVRYSYVVFLLNPKYCIVKADTVRSWCVFHVGKMWSWRHFYVPGPHMWDTYCCSIVTDIVWNTLPCVYMFVSLYVCLSLDCLNRFAFGLVWSRRSIVHFAGL